MEALSESDPVAEVAATAVIEEAVANPEEHLIRRSKNYSNTFRSFYLF